MKFVWCSVRACAIVLIVSLFSKSLGQWKESFAPYPVGAAVYANLGAWSGYPTVNDSLSVSNYAFDDQRSLNASAGLSGAQHSLGNKSQGAWTLVYGMSSWIGAQGSVLGLHFNASPSPQLKITQTPGQLAITAFENTTSIPFTYSDAWRCFRIYFDLEKDKASIFVDNSLVLNINLLPNTILNKVSVKAGTSGLCYYDSFLLAQASEVVQLIGKKDNFGGGLDLYPYLSPQLKAKNTSPWIGWRGVDEFYFDAPFGATIPFMPCGSCGPWAGTLEFRCEANAIASNDTYAFGLSNSGIFMDSRSFSTVVGQPWLPAVGKVTFVEPLSSAQINQMLMLGRFDFYLQDDTDTDYVELRTSQACPKFGGGHVHTVGDASLSASDNGLIYTGTYAGGSTSGFEGSVGQGSGAILKFADSTDRKIAGQNCSFRAIGIEPSGTTHILGDASLSGLGTAARVAMSFASIGSTAIRIDLYNAAGQKCQICGNKWSDC